MSTTNKPTIQSINESRNIILTQMSEFCKSLPEYAVIREMPGIGDKLAPRIIAEIGDVRRFKNKHSLIAYAGIDAPPYQSGTFNSAERHISKRGTVTCEKRVLKSCKAWFLISLRVLLFTTSFKRNVSRENVAKKL